MTRFSAYDHFAWLYNKYWSDFAGRVLPVLDELVFDDLPEEPRVLDLCCGTGQLAQLLTERGYQVTGVDGSGAMLAYARKNAPTCKFIMADARDFEAGTGYHAVVSTFDSLNHIMTLDGLGLVFRNVLRTLAPGGVFVFDLNVESGYLARWNGTSFGMVEDDYAFIVRNSFNRETQIAKFMLTMFFREGDSPNWARSDITLTQRSYPEALVVAALEAAGFVQVETAQPMGMGRTFFVAVSPDDA